MTEVQLKLLACSHLKVLQVQLDPGAELPLLGLSFAASTPSSSLIGSGSAWWLLSFSPATDRWQSQSKMMTKTLLHHNTGPMEGLRLTQFGLLPSYELVTLDREREAHNWSDLSHMPIPAAGCGRSPWSTSGPDGCTSLVGRWCWADKNNSVQLC